MFSFFKKKLRSALSPTPVDAPALHQVPASSEAGGPAGTAEPVCTPAAAVPSPAPLKPQPKHSPTGGSMIGSALVTPIDIPQALALVVAPERQRWFSKLQQGLRNTGSSISTVFTGSRIDEQLYEDLETALLMADTGVNATLHLLEDVKRRVKEGGMTHPVAVRNALIEAITVLLKPLEKPLVIGEFTPTVIMVTGVNGAGKTTSIGKLTRHLANEGASVLLAAADTFRAAAREQLSVWADRNTVEIVSQENGDPAAVSFDAVKAGKARGKDVVLVDTAGRLPTQLHLMEELRKIKRVVQKADLTAPHEILLVIDGNTGQNALAQVKAFDDTLQLTGLVVTKLDGTAKGGVLAAIALWARERAQASPGLRPVAVYFIGVGEKLEDLETFNAREFAQALLG
ncbi:MAG: signal recognition particle-docking protein FtsY [Polaromonas sp.]